MVRAAAAFAEHGIEMTVVRYANESHCRRAVEVYDFDALLLQEPPVYEFLLDIGKPVILLERVDGAQLRASRKYLDDDRVAGVIKSYLFRDRALYNTTYDRAHIAAMHFAELACTRPLHRDELPEPQISEVGLAKLHVGYSGFGCHQILKQCIDRRVDLEMPRATDVWYMGTVDYEGTEIDTHRRLAIRAAESYPGQSVTSAGRVIQRPHYYDALQNSRTALCPWGWGEGTYREYEAMALGTVVIKPDTSYVEADPDVYRPGETYVPCRPDFSDAHEKIAEVCDHWDDYTPMRYIAREKVRRAWRPASIAKRMSTVIREILAC
jgi:hypothetical protein